MDSSTRKPTDEASGQEVDTHGRSISRRIPRGMIRSCESRSNNPRQDVNESTKHSAKGFTLTVIAKPLHSPSKRCMHFTRTTAPT